MTSSSRAGTVRTLVAVGTDRLASMFATIRDAAPRSWTGSSLADSPTEVGTGAVAAGAVVAAAGVAAGTGAAAEPGAPERARGPGGSP